MEKKLLLLGLLRSQEMHGYLLNEMLAQGAGASIKLTKSNAYRLLNKMEHEGWITYREEREGNRPPRRVYTITSTGEAVFQQMLRESLAGFPPPELPSMVALNYLGLLSPSESLALLAQRREKIATQFKALTDIPEEVRNSHLGMSNLHHYYLTELQWLDEAMDDLAPSG